MNMRYKGTLYYIHNFSVNRKLFQNNKFFKKTIARTCLSNTNFLLALVHNKTFESQVLNILISIPYSSFSHSFLKSYVLWNLLDPQR